MAHTPGPWLIEEGPSMTGGKDYRDISAPTWGALARVVVRIDGKASSEGEANARLIAAAPDLLAALKAILPWHDSHPVEATDNSLINRCRVAIAKAEND